MSCRCVESGRCAHDALIPPVHRVR